jgi:hypothetical protein
MLETKKKSNSKGSNANDQALATFPAILATLIAQLLYPHPPHQA